MLITGYDDAKVIARGGFATVYRARQRTFQRDVAVKVLELSLDKARDRHRVELECAAMGRLTGHPHIVWVLDSGFTHDGRPYLTTPFYRRGSLSRRLERQGPLDVAEVLHIGVAIAGALEAAHLHGILHRDVKPGNILVSPYGEPALTDFGIASLAQAGSPDQSHPTQSFSVVNAPPESFDGVDGSIAGDVYGLCSTLWTLLTGHPPFEPEGDESIARSIYRAQFEPVPHLEREDVPEELERILVEGMAKAPADRPASARAVGAALQAVQSSLGLPVTPLRVVDGEDAPGDEPDTDLAEAVAVGDAAAEPAGDGPSPGSVGTGAPADGDGPADDPQPDRVAPPPTPAPWRGRLAPAGGNGRTAPIDLTDLRASVPDGPAPEPVADAVTKKERTATWGAPTLPAAPAGGGNSPTSVFPAGPPTADGEATADPIPEALAPLPPPPPPADGRRAGLVLPTGPVVIVLVAAVVAAMVILAAFVISRRDGAVETTGAEATTTTQSTPAPAPTTAAPAAQPRPSPTTAAPAPAPTASVPAPGPAAAGGERVSTAAGIAQGAATALAQARWNDARSLIVGLPASDEPLVRDWGGLEAVTMVVVDSRDDGSTVTLRLGEIAHETVGGQNRTSLYCVTWAVADGRIVNMRSLQTIGAPWRAGEWVPAEQAVPVVQSQCTRL